MGDGTTSVVVLAGELLREAERLVDQRVHPMTIIAGTCAAAISGPASVLKACTFRALQWVHPQQPKLCCFRHWTCTTACRVQQSVHVLRSILRPEPWGWTAFRRKLLNRAHSSLSS